MLHAICDVFCIKGWIFNCMYGRFGWSVRCLYISAGVVRRGVLMVVVVVLYLPFGGIHRVMVVTWVDR